MLTTIPMSQARRRLRRIAALVAKRHVFIVTKKGKAFVMIDAPEQLDEREPKQGAHDTR